MNTEPQDVYTTEKRTVRSKRITPSNEPCPKCASMRADRKLYFKGNKVEREYGDCFNKFINMILKYSEFFIKDTDSYSDRNIAKECIVSKCKCCGYMWPTKPLS